MFPPGYQAVTFAIHFWCPLIAGLLPIPADAGHQPQTPGTQRLCRIGLEKPDAALVPGSLALLLRLLPRPLVHIGVTPPILGRTAVQQMAASPAIGSPAGAPEAVLAPPAQGGAEAADWSRLVQYH